LRAMSSDQVSRALKGVLERVGGASALREQHIAALCPAPRLVAVSKTKPKEMVMEAYRAGQRHFGENYVKELVEKGGDPEVLERCPDIRWHMIGPLQSNKVNKVLSVPGLHLLETLHSAKLASTVDAAWGRLAAKSGREDTLAVYVQVNTSGEATKSGVAPSEAPALAQHITDTCPHLALRGLMTIGGAGEGARDFKVLFECRSAVCEALGVAAESLELSMGMSGDFEEAIKAGSGNVRVGSTIFGARSYP